MQPDQPTQPTQEQTPAVAQPESNLQPIDPLAPPSKKKGVLLPILLMVTPFLLIIVSIILYGITNLLLGSEQPATTPSENGLFGEEAPNPARSILNALLFIMGTISVIGLIPCFIIGLVLLIQRLKK